MKFCFGVLGLKLPSILMQGVNPETVVREASETSKASHTEAVKGDPDKKTKTIAVYAGLAGLIGLVYLLAKKEPRRQEKDRE